MAKNAAIKLGALEQIRKWADYEPSSRAKLEQELTQAILNARWILNNLEI